MKPLNLLFTSAGRRVALIRHFKQVLADLGIPGRIVTTDLKKDAPAPFLADSRELVPRVSDPSYIPTLLEICRRHEIALLVPLIDTELHLLSPHRADFEAVGTRLLVSSTDTNDICLDKRRTGEFFERAGVDGPRVLDADELLRDPQTPYPVLLKPADGSCSIGVTKIRNAHELAFFKDYIPNAMVQELLVGEEYTIDVLVDFEGRVRCVVPRLRMETRAGEVSKGMTVKHSRLIGAAKQVVEALPGAVGCITVQCFLMPDGTIKFIEINPRFGGGFPLAIAAGADFPRWILQWMLGEDPPIALDGWQDETVMLRYDDAVFVRRGDIT
jgi:carbamoyl-phosphate synthase large subunit